MQKYKDEYSKVALLSRLRATSMPSALSVWRIYLSPVLSLNLELCLLFKTLQVGISPHVTILQLFSEVIQKSGSFCTDMESYILSDVCCYVN